MQSQLSNCRCKECKCEVLCSKLTEKEQEIQILKEDLQDGTLDRVRFFCCRNE